MKTSLTILFLFVFLLNLHAQNQQKGLTLTISNSLDFNISKKVISFGNRGLNNIKYDKTNYNTGINAEYRFKDNCLILSGIHYSNKDFTGSPVGPEYIFVPPQRIELRYIEIPLLLKFYFNPHKLRFFGLLGIKNQFNLTKEKKDYIYQFIEYKNFSVGAMFGGGAEYHLNPRIAIQLYSNYNKGLSNIFKNSNYKLDYLSLGAGIKIAI